nr:extracellular solute-binding protein [bacterium]
KCHPLSMDVNSAYYLLPWYFGMGGKLFKDNALHVEKNAFIQTCNFWLDLNYKKNLMFPIVEFEYKKSLNYFAAGNLAFLIDGPWAIPFLQSANVDFGIADLPYNSSAKRYVSPFIGTQLLCVSSKTEISEDIKKFLEIMTSLEIQIEFARESGKLPANNSAYNKLDKEKDWRIFAFYNQLKKGTPLPSSNEMNKLWSVLSQDNLINIFNKKETAENFANKNKEFFK